VRHLRYLPLTFLAGVHGFLIFAPYLLVLGLLAAAYSKSTRGPL
jgi:hypothetical protein